MSLPEYVYQPRAKGRQYTYYQFRRGRDDEGPRIRLPDPSAKNFAAELARAQALYEGTAPGPKGETVAWLIAEFRDSERFKNVSKRSQDVYNVHLNRMEKPEAWGNTSARGLLRKAVNEGVKALRDTPGMANQLVDVGRMLYDWGIANDKLGDTPHNPFDKVEKIDMGGDRGHIPWPTFIVEYIDRHAWNDIRRMVCLGVMTCQRESDLIRMGHIHRDGAGIWVRPKKTRRKRKAFRIPLASKDVLELDRWAETPIRFTNTRFLKPFERFNPDVYLYSPRAAAYTDTALRARWNRWLATEEGKELCRLWSEWLARMIQKFEWDVDPEDVTQPTIHGLRGTGFLKRHAAGYTSEQIANDCGAHRKTVEHYMRFRDQVEISEANRKLAVIQGDRA